MGPGFFRGRGFGGPKEGGETEKIKVSTIETDPWQNSIKS
jgi:hypothetical protein